MHRRPNLARGFSVIELLVVIGIIVILISIFLPYVIKARESDHRARCAENLRTLMASLRAYSSANKGVFPRVQYDPAHNPNGYVAYTGAAAADPFVQDTTVRPNDVTASLWLLVRARLAKPSFFICPSTADLPESLDVQSTTTRSNFSSGHNLSYSYASPFTNTPGYKLDDFLPADFALLADKNPGVDPSTGANVIGPTWDAKPFALAVANSTNHRRAGQNVLYADGHVSFQPTPFCGFGKDGLRDNIYTALSRTPIPKVQNPATYAPGVVGRDVGPAWERDSYLVPTAQD